MEVSADLLGDFLHTIYEGFDTSKEIEPKMWRALQRTMNEAAAEGLAHGEYQPRHNDRFLDAMRHGNEVFAAFKVHAMGKAMADKLRDSNGNIKPFEQWSNDVRTIASHHTGAWLRTEYNTAVLRAHAAADWQEFIENKDIFPNLRWMPTTSPDAEASHRSYWEKKLTLPIEHPFWEKHHPQDRWNCKCMLEATDDPATPANVVEDMPTPQPQRGLDNNPGKDGHLINDTHPYFPEKCAQCPYYKPRGVKNRMRAMFVAHKKDCFNCEYVNEKLPDSNKQPEALREAQVQASIHIKEFKVKLDAYKGAKLEGEEYTTGSLTILRRSLTDVYEHNREDATLMEWLKHFEMDSIKGWKYEGYAENRPYPPEHPKFDPSNPGKKKHQETIYFTYYSLNIGDKEYWANVKVHKDYGEVLYTIESTKPKDLKRGVRQ